MPGNNVKEFFGEYLKARRVISNSDCSGQYSVHGELNRRCLQAFEKFIYSYQWCNSETERQLFDNIIRGIPLIRMRIKVEKKGVMKELQPSSIRTASSRLTKRMFDIFGSDCFGVLLGNPGVEAEKIALQKLLALCISLTDDYVFQNHYSSGLQSLIENHIRPISGVSVPDKVEFSKEIVDVVTFFREIDNDTVFSRLKELDLESVAVVYAILSRKEYFNQRSELLLYLDKNIRLGEGGVSRAMYEDKIKELKQELADTKNLANRKLDYARKKIAELEAKVNGG